LIYKWKKELTLTQLLDIIIVNYNSTDFLLSCLQSIYHTLHKFSGKVFVQDNSSEDDIDRVKVLYRQVILSKNPVNLGYAKACNQALSESRAAYAVLMNPDTLVLGDFFEYVLRYMEENSQVGILGPKIVNFDESVQGSARSFPTFLTGLFGRKSALTKWFPNNRFSRQNVVTARSDGVTPIEVDWVSGACMVVRRRAIETVGPLDERFFLYWEDADWCKRMWEAGWKVVYYPQASIKHLVGGSSQRSPLRSTVEFHKSAYRLFAKHATGAQRSAIPLAMGALALRLFLSLTWNGMHHWSGRIYSKSRPKNTFRN
jgi:GT2 family glycosyltransferase